MRDRPELPEGVRWYWEAFWTLNESRQIGFGLGFIPLSEINVYAQMFNVVDVPTFALVIRGMDRVYVHERHEQEKANQTSVIPTYVSPALANRSASRTRKAPRSALCRRPFPAP